MIKKSIRVGISSCLLGEEVHFDGGHKHDTLITETLGKFFEWVPVCPEMEIGLGTPRESLRLVGIPQARAFWRQNQGRTTPRRRAVTPLIALRNLPFWKVPERLDRFQ